MQGGHYKDSIECIKVLELLESTGAGFHEIQAVRYIWRAGRKTGESKEKDLKKALNYLHRKLEGKWFYE
ncbi:MAG: hypothetical protein BV458_03465 [Thermoplasmata archaeon M9B2D]|nr:MAG: hypothetical protein BV458_03465 [Thermoplasmata archaeon M9B2D]